MPSHDENGKRLSGAQQQRLKRRRIEQGRREQAAERKRLGLPGLDFRDLPPPPYGQPLRMLPWCMDVLQVCADLTMRDSFMPVPTKLRLVASFAAKAGMIRDGAIEQRLILNGLTGSDAALDTARPL